MHTVPNILREIPSPPNTLFIKGNSLEEGFTGIAIVGTRKASPFGMALAEKTAKELSLAGFAIISGLALGIDSAAHKGCLSAKGRTVAVLAGGIKKIYPATNVSLAEKIICSGGSVISEYEDIPSYPDLFLKRNRIISGLSLAIIIIEAPFKSGAVSTANWAAEQGREVFVFPGSVSDRNYDGSHKLIRDGARIVTSTRDIIEDLGFESQPEKESIYQDLLSKGAKEVLNIISISVIPISVDKIVSATKLEPREVMTFLSELSLSEHIIESGSGYIATNKLV
jgi:DNA processing protein